jgi:hypothetical protein
MRRDAVEAVALVTIVIVVDDLGHIECVAGDHAEIFGDLAGDVEFDAAAVHHADGLRKPRIDRVALDDIRLGEIEQSDARRQIAVEPNRFDAGLPLEGLFRRKYPSARIDAIVRAE